MKKGTAAAVLFLLVASWLGGIFAAGCMAESGPMPAGISSQLPPCCNMIVACANGTCTSALQTAGCLPGFNALAVEQKVDLAGIAMEPPQPVIVSAVMLTAAATVDPPPLIGRARARVKSVDYSDVHARTGRLLI